MCAMKIHQLLCFLFVFYLQTEKKPGESLLCQNSLVELWMKWRESKNESVLPTVGRFYVLKEHHFKEFDDFREKYGQGLRSRVILEDIELLQFWRQKAHIPVHSVVEFGKKFVWIDRPYMDSLCEWLMEKKESYRSVGDSVFDE